MQPCGRANAATPNRREKTTMRIFWWKDGLHIEPESDQDRTFLSEGLNVLDGIRIDHEIPSSPVIAVQASNEDSVVGIDESTKVIS